MKVPLTQLGDNVHVVAGLEDVMQGNDIGVTHSLHNIDLAVQVLEVEG